MSLRLSWICLLFCLCGCESVKEPPMRTSPSSYRPRNQLRYDVYRPKASLSKGGSEPLSEENVLPHKRRSAQRYNSYHPSSHGAVSPYSSHSPYSLFQKKITGKDLE